MFYTAPPMTWTTAPNYIISFCTNLHQISESFTFKPCGHVPGAGCRTRLVVVGELRILLNADRGSLMDAGL